MFQPPLQIGGDDHRASERCLYTSLGAMQASLIVHHLRIPKDMLVQVR